MALGRSKKSGARICIDELDILANITPQFKIWNDGVVINFRTVPGGGLIGWNKGRVSGFSKIPSHGHQLKRLLLLKGAGT